jgi:hypothetical protein
VPTFAGGFKFGFYILEDSMIGYLNDANDEEVEVELSGTISKYHAATMYKNNGDPGDPEEGGELEDFTVTLDGVDITEYLKASDYKNLALYFQENYEDDEQGRREAYLEDQEQARKDDLRNMS